MAILKRIGGNYEYIAKCACCPEIKTVTIQKDDFIGWQGGEYIQDAAPYLSASDREFLISGICGDCFDMMWEDQDDE